MKRSGGRRLQACYRKIEVEVETADDALAAARAGADILLLDNMTTGQCPDIPSTNLNRQGYVIRSPSNFRVALPERLSGNTRGPGLMSISLGILTHSVRNFFGNARHPEVVIFTWDPGSGIM